MLDPNGCAFPIPEGDTHPHAYGITAREYFALTLMQGLLAGDNANSYHVERLADKAVELADALIARLNVSQS